MLEQLVILVIGLELIAAQGICNKVIPVSHNNNDSISFDELSQALDEVNTALFNALGKLCQIRGRLEISKPRGDLDDVPRDCQDVFDQGYQTTDVYMIYPLNSSPFQVRCDQTTDGGGWTVIQRRVSDSDFFRTWHEYKDGFGDLDSNFWLGNDNIHTLTASGSYSLRVDLIAVDGDKGYAEYSTFYVGEKSSKYRLKISGYNGTIGDGMQFSNGMMFSTRDSENDAGEEWDCANVFTGAWWYNSCFGANLNGVYGEDRLAWLPWKEYTSLTMTEMKIRKVSSMT